MRDFSIPLVQPPPTKPNHKFQPTPCQKPVYGHVVHKGPLACMKLERKNGIVEPKPKEKGTRTRFTRKVKKPTPSSAILLTKSKRDPVQPEDLRPTK